LVRGCWGEWGNSVRFFSCLGLFFFFLLFAPSIPNRRCRFWDESELHSAGVQNARRLQAQATAIGGSQVLCARQGEGRGARVVPGNEEPREGGAWRSHASRRGGFWRRSRVGYEHRRQHFFFFCDIVLLILAPTTAEWLCPLHGLTCCVSLFHSLCVSCFRLKSRQFSLVSRSVFHGGAGTKDWCWWFSQFGQW